MRVCVTDLFLFRFSALIYNSNLIEIGQAVFEKTDISRYINFRENARSSLGLGAPVKELE
jgi:hypothetical protein